MFFLVKVIDLLNMRGRLGAGNPHTLVFVGEAVMWRTVSFRVLAGLAVGLLSGEGVCSSAGAANAYEFGFQTIDGAPMTLSRSFPIK
jgi:hypothetical protein